MTDIRPAWYETLVEAIRWINACQYAEDEDTRQLGEKEAQELVGELRKLGFLNTTRDESIGLDDSWDRVCRIAVSGWTNSWTEVAEWLGIPTADIELGIANGELHTFDGFTCSEWLRDWIKEGRRRNEREAEHLIAGLTHLFEAIVWPLMAHQGLFKVYNYTGLFDGIHGLKRVLTNAGPHAEDVLAAKLGPRQDIGASIIRVARHQRHYRETEPASLLRKELRQLRDQKERDPHVRYQVALWEMGQPEEKSFWIVEPRSMSLLQVWCTENGFTTGGDQCPKPRSWAERCATLRQYGGDWLEWDESDPQNNHGWYRHCYRGLVKRARQRWKYGALWTLDDPGLRRTIWGIDDPADAAAIRSDLMRVWVRGSV